MSRDCIIVVFFKFFSRIAYTFTCPYYILTSNCERNKQAVPKNKMLCNLKLLLRYEYL